ncbi:MAG TPA: AI-2E family transporter, partial [Candidatus Paceibacterota bacterium]|nr:AI-2E family transporter [Candidatus Paceibacterota bacterium]
MDSLKTIRVSSDTFVRLFLIALAIYGLFLIRDILILILVAIVIASFVESGVRYLSRYRLRRTLSVSIIYTISILILFAIFYAFVPIIFRELSGVLSLISQYLPSSNLDSQSIEGATQLVTTISQKGSFADLLGNIKSLAVTFSAGFTSVIGGTFGGVVNIILVFVMSFYLSVQERGIETFLRIL